MRNTVFSVTAVLMVVSALPLSGQQPVAVDRLPSAVLDAAPPSAWIQGERGQMTVQRRECRDFPPSEIRRRIVDIAAQEWAFFGFPVLDRMNDLRVLPPGSVGNPHQPIVEPSQGRAPVFNLQESIRLDPTIAGYWAVTPEGPGIVSTQNRAWNGNGNAGIRWRSPWSAAFISWVMCEAGLGDNDRFRRAIAHRSYIDQAIRARDGQAPQAAFVAYDLGERAVEPGDLLCAARRPMYRNIAERRRQLGVGANSHCDIVVEVDEAGGRILAIGGNVLRAVSLKVFPALPRAEGGVRPSPEASGRPLFAHLKLQAAPIEADALTGTPTLRAFACDPGDPAGGRGAYILSELAVGPSPGVFC